MNRQFPPARHVTARPSANGSRKLVVAALSCSALSLASLSAAAVIGSNAAGTGPAADLAVVPVAAAPAGPAAGSVTGKGSAAAAAAKGPPRALKAISTPADQPRKGLVYRGLVAATRGSCLGGYQVAGIGGLCSHGPDAAPPGLDPKIPVSPVTLTEPAVVTAGDGLPDEQTLAAESLAGTVAAAVAATPGTTVPCFGDGATGNRVQVLYVHGSSDRFATYLESLRTWAVGIDTIYDASAAETGGTRHVRFVTEPVTDGCRPAVTSVAVADTALASFSATVTAVKAQGFSRSDRKYVMFTDTNVYCGIGGFAGDETKSATNRSNFGPSYGRTDNGCWSPSTAAHELGHNLGAVNNSAPNSSGGGHCVDEFDVMCYSDSPNFPTMQVRCADRAHDARLDCNHDDYYSTAPPAGSYLAGHFNVADNVFLVAGAGDGTGGGGAVPDTQPPTVPTGLTAGGVTASSVALTWSASTDNVAVTGYDVFRNGVAAGSSGGTSVTVSGLTPGTSHTFTVKARDAAGNLSAAGPGLTVQTAAGTAGPSVGKTFVLVNAGTGAVLDVSRSSATTGTKLVHAASSGATSQRWTAVAGANGSLQWRNASSGLCMTVLNGSTAQGAAIVQQACADATSQQWKAVDRGSGRFELVNLRTGLAVSYGSDRIDGLRVAVQRTAGQSRTSRMWTFRATA